MSHEYDVLVVGSGPAGYVAAIRSAQLGFKTACIDHWRNSRRQFQAGGTYINGGCIACIALLESAKLHHLLRHELVEHGLRVEGIAIDLPRMMARKHSSIERLSHHIGGLFQHYRIVSVRMVSFARFRPEAPRKCQRVSGAVTRRGRLCILQVASAPSG